MRVARVYLEPIADRYGTIGNVESPLLGRWRGLIVNAVAIAVEPHMSGLYQPRAMISVHRECQMEWVGPDGLERQDIIHRQDLLAVALPDFVLPTVEALMSGDLRGRSEEVAACQIFWEACVKNDDGLRALFDLDAETGRLHAARRWYTRPCAMCGAVGLTSFDWDDWGQGQPMHGQRRVQPCGHIERASRVDIERRP